MNLTALDLDPTSLAALVAVIDAGSFTAAARELGVSHPAVSLAIKRLEERVGTSLLVRSRKGITPSRPGQILAAGAKLSFEALAESLAQIADERAEPSGRVLLGCHESLAAYTLPAFMAEFLRKYPRVELALWNGTSAAVGKQLIAGGVDLALVVNPHQHPDMVISPLFEDSVELFHCFPLKQRKRPKALLAQNPLIYVPELRQSQEILHKLEQQSAHALRLLECSSLDLVKNLVLDLVGVGILPRRVAEHRTQKRLVSLSPPMPRYRDQVSLVRRYDLPMTAAIRAVVDGLTSHAREA